MTPEEFDSPIVTPGDFDDIDIVPDDERLLKALDAIPLLMFDAWEQLIVSNASITLSDTPLTHTREWVLIREALACAREAHAAIVYDLLERAREAEDAAYREVCRAERTVANGLTDIVIQRIGEDFDPHGYFVYLLWGDDPDVPLYVGQSTNVLSRLGSHLGERRKRDAVRRVTVLRCPNAFAMDATERRLITQYQPPLNTIGIR